MMGGMMHTSFCFASGRSHQVHFCKQICCVSAVSLATSLQVVAKYNHAHVRKIAHDAPATTMRKACQAP